MSERGRTRNTSGGINVISATLSWRDANGSQQHSETEIRSLSAVWLKIKRDINRHVQVK